MTDDDITRSDVLNSMSETRRTGRRGVLRGVLAGALAGLGFAGPASALTDPDGSAGSIRAARMAFDSERAARAALERWGAGVLDTLHAEGLIERPALDALTVEDLHVAAFQARGIATAHVVASATVEAGALRLAVRPHAGESYAIFGRGDERTLYTASGVEDDCFQGMSACYDDYSGSCTEYSVMCCPDGDAYQCIWDERIGSCSCPGVYDCTMSCPI